MIDPKLLSMLRCPIGGGRLSVADDSLIQRVRSAIDRGEALDRLDQRVADPIDGGLVDERGVWLFPIRHGIPTLVADEAIRLDSITLDSSSPNP